MGPIGKYLLFICSKRVHKKYIGKINNNNSEENNFYTINSSNEQKNVYSPYNERIETYVVPLIFLIIFILGVIGNGTLVLVFLKHHVMRTVTNTYIFSLALADLLVLIISVPFTSIIYTFESYPWGVVVCKVTECAKYITIGVSVFTLTALSVERYSAIVKPLRRFHMKPLTFFVAIIIWIISIGLAIPTAIFARIEHAVIERENGSISSISYCTPYAKNELYAKITVVFKSIIYYIIPLIIIAYYYILMALRLQISVKEMPAEISSVQSLAQANSRRHVAKMVLIFVLLFFIFFLPQQVFLLWFHLNPTSESDYNDFWHILKISGFFLSFLHSCVNPIALYCISAVFRVYFNRYLFCRKSAASNNNPHNAE